ncbi:MAG: YggS family pyridoxal phosphate-dependent enzyme [Clostridia bacterium]|nr:YggS family pyridoxal phosphate-dependent enzyme [Clostridia bacterium]
MSSTPKEFLESNLNSIRSTIEASCQKAGRAPCDVQILGVSKTVEPDIMEQAFDLGIKEFGENRVQEYLRKSDILHRDCCWHIIGRIQTNKVKYLDSRVKLIHSLDRMELAEALSERGSKINHRFPVLIQVNVAGEETKAGISPQGAKDFALRVSRLGNIDIKGLMTIAPYTETPEEVRYVFRSIKQLSVDIMRERVENINMEVLSMGMSNDFHIAVEEGATMVRIGSALFGERVY